MNKNVDVICRHMQRNRIIPLRIAVMDNDKEIQSYIVKSNRVIKPVGKTMVLNGKKYPQSVICYQCKIIVFGVERIVGLIYNTQTMGWNIVY